ncbi:MAG TPA: hypothetical protein PKD26_12560 [Pyrinomonadaceae bacterium]|nr:hypothetical protein [Pyrinomonadaceae bacterium]
MNKGEKNSGSAPSLARFLVLNGIVLFGIPVALITAIFRAFTASVPWQEYLFSTPALLAFAAQAIVGGLVFGSIVWFLKRRARSV